MSKNIEVSDETFEKIKDQLNSEETKEIINYGDMIGEKYFFRTVTYHIVGRVKKQVGTFLQLEHTSWVADSGRFMQAIKDGSLDEVEPVGVAYVNIEGIVDMFPWKHPLPTKQK